MAAQPSPWVNVAATVTALGQSIVPEEIRAAMDLLRRAHDDEGQSDYFVCFYFHYGIGGFPDYERAYECFDREGEERWLAAMRDWGQGPPGTRQGPLRPEVLCDHWGTNPELGACANVLALRERAAHAEQRAQRIRTFDDAQRSSFIAVTSAFRRALDADRDAIWAQWPSGTEPRLIAPATRETALWESFDAALERLTATEPPHARSLTRRLEAFHCATELRARMGPSGTEDAAELAEAAAFRAALKKSAAAWDNYVASWLALADLRHVPGIMDSVRDVLLERRATMLQSLEYGNSEQIQDLSPSCLP